MADLLALAERCEAATVEQQRSLLLEAYDAIHPTDPDARFLRFKRLVDAGAFVDAALTLVPDGWRFVRYTWARPDEPCDVLLVHSSNKARDGKGHMLALAICAAALRARAAQSGITND